MKVTVVPFYVVGLSIGQAKKASLGLSKVVKSLKESWMKRVKSRRGKNS